jgi:enoyl-CoA hydratase/carnithine racemase
MECFSLEVVDHVATITMTRPPVNAQNRQFRHECVALFDEMHDREDVRAIILTGAADFNQDGGVDFLDVQSFFTVWERGDSSADVNRDGGVDGPDVESFIRVWEAGGC